MILRLFNFFSGYVVIKVSGFSVERFINLAMNRNIFLSDIKYCKNYVTMKVSIEGFRQLKPIAKKTRCNVSIIKKSGLPFLVFRYRKRKILAIGVLFFVISIYLLSTRVWLVNLEGLDRVDHSTLESFLKNEGLYISGKKSKIDKEKIKEDIINNFEDVAWVNIDLKGTKATVSIKETIVKEMKADTESTKPTNIVAKQDGIIDTIVVSKGTGKVKPLDVVKKGDILIGGELVVKEDEFGVLKNYVASSGEVMAKTYYTFNFFVPFNYEEKVFTGQKEVDRRYKIFNKNYEMLKPSISFENYNRISTYDELSLGEDYPLPFVIIEDVYSDFFLENKVRTKEEASELAYKIADNKILHELAFDVNIVDKRVELSENKDGIEVSVYISALEDIGESIEIDEASMKETENNTTKENSNLQ